MRRERTIPLGVVTLGVVSFLTDAMDEGQARAYLSDLSEEENRATAIGIYGFVTGLVYFPASLIAGALWTIGPAWTFAFAIGTSVAALALFLTVSGRSKETSERRLKGYQLD